MTLQARKHKLIKKINRSENAELIMQLEKLVEDKTETKLTNNVDLLELAVSIEDELNIEELIKEQGFKNPTKEALDEIIKNANITESTDKLLNMI